MKTVELKDQIEYLIKIDKPKSIRHGRWEVGVFYKDLMCFNLNPTVPFQQISEFIEISDIKKLRHHYDSTLGLYAFDKPIDSFFEDCPDEGKTVIEAHLIQQINKLKNIIFQIV